MAHWLVSQCKRSVRRVCKLLGLSQSVYRYEPKPKDDIEVIEHMNHWVSKKPTWGFWKVYTRVRKDGRIVNHKRLYRLYIVAGLNLRRPTKKRVPERVKEPLCLPIGPNITWSMDFMADRLLNGNKLRTFNVIDDFGREALNITIDTSIRAQYVTRELDKLIEWRGKPERLRVDNGPEFIAQEMELWAERNGIELTFIEKGRPMQNGLVERFNRTYREEVLDAYLFESLEQLRRLTIEFIWSYNTERPHDALLDLTPREFLLKYGQLPAYHTGSRADFPTFQQDEHTNITEMVNFRNSRA
jgi:putative transposase